MKIGITGPAASGKTSVAKAFADKFGINYLEIPTSRYMKEHSLYNHYDILRYCVNYPREGIKFHESLIKDRFTIMSETPGPWVTDRLSIDSYVYYIIQCSAWNHDVELNKELFDISIANLCSVDFVVKYDYSSELMRLDNGKRVLNDSWHMGYQYILDSLLDKYTDSYRYYTPKDSLNIKVPSIEERVNRLYYTLLDRQLWK